MKYSSNNIDIAIRIKLDVRISFSDQKFEILSIK